jgi:predicted RNA polymerase sigma factor
MDDLLLREVTPAVIGVLVHRGVDFATAEDAVQEALIQAALTWPDRQPADPKGWLVTVAWRKFLDVHRSEASRRNREQRVEAEPPPGPTETADDTLQLFFLCAHPSLTGLRGGPHAARRRWLDHPADRPGLPRAGGDDGAADQPGQTHGR